MAVLPRISLTASALRISREGVNVNNPQSFTPEHLVINSDWGSVERRYSIGIRTKTNLLENPVLNFTPLPEPPLAVLLMRLPGTATIQDGLTHDFDAIVNGIRVEFIQDTHYISKVTINQVFLAQKKGQNINGEFPNYGPPNTFANETRYDFIVMLFKQGLS